jgi:hypothetical protein
MEGKTVGIPRVAPNTRDTQELLWLIDLALTKGKVSMPDSHPVQKKRKWGNGSRRIHQCGDGEKKGMLGKNSPHEEDEESKHTRETVCMKDRRSIFRHIKPTVPSR